MNVAKSKQSGQNINKTTLTLSLNYNTKRRLNCHYRDVMIDKHKRLE